MAALSQAELLQRVPLFKCLSEAQANALAHATEKKRFKRHERIVEVGQPSHSLFIILSGTARVILSSEKGREIILSALQSGDCVGEMGLIDEQPHCATVVADSALDALVMDNAALRKCLLQNAPLTVAIMGGMVSRMRKANQKIADLALVSVYGRVARSLTEMSVAVPPDNLTAVVKKFSNINLAKEIGASREMVSKALKDFEKQGFIRRQEDGSLLLIERRGMPHT